MRVTIRPATRADAAQVAGVYLASRKRFVPFAPLAHSDDDVRSWIATTLIPSGHVVVAETEAGICGVMGISTTDGISWIDQLYIAPGAVGQGVGSELLMTAMDTLRYPIRVFTFQENAGARRFYERHGFRPMAWSDGSDNEERCPDVLYECAAKPAWPIKG